MVDGRVWVVILVRAGCRGERVQGGVNWAPVQESMTARRALAALLLAAQAHVHADAFAVPQMSVRPGSLTPSSDARASPGVKLPVLLRPPRRARLCVSCSAGGNQPEPADEEAKEDVFGSLPKEGRAAEDVEKDEAMSARINETAKSGAQDPSEGPSRVKKAFKLAWKEKFKGKGVDLTIPPKEEALANLGREIETDPCALQDLRARSLMLAARLEAAVSEERYSEAAALRDQLQMLRLQDPLYLREHLWSEMQAAGQEGNLGKAAALRLSVQEVERFLPQYKLGGEWEGIYASHGKETVLIRYEGSTLVALKLTGDENVPKGEITFTADLSPQGLLGAVGRDEFSHPAEKIRTVLEGHLDNIVAIRGRGQVARPGFKSAQFVDGQLLIFEEGVLGFIFLPLAAMIVFERPRPPAEPEGTSALNSSADPDDNITPDLQTGPSDGGRGGGSLKRDRDAF